MGSRLFQQGSGSATFTVGVQGSTGIVIGFSWEEGLSVRLYASGGLNIGIPPFAGFGITFGLNLDASSVHDLNEALSSIGGGVSVGPGFTIDVATDKNVKPMPNQGLSLTVGLKGPPPAVEVHRANEITIAPGITMREVLEGMDKLIDEYLIIPILESVPW
jgi:hypothetical protein